eukprot:TRINITY_DN13080_c0_g1_i1.p1 TRINITY_DN13080_c0_g1~~TRINITY_DN13080_c0_g1_i1.p1  ORF type:complete len:240 (-),score=63.41 TRINITY_DN13080_c0_g1_i1:6-725(-)
MLTDPNYSHKKNSTSSNGNSKPVTHFKTQSTEELFKSFFGNRNIPLDPKKFENPPPQASPIIKVFHCSLEDLYCGGTKRMRITKDIYEGTGKPKSVEKIVTINIEKGWKSGTRITFEKEGDVKGGMIPADIIFELEEKSHERFERKMNDLHYHAEISLEEALVGCNLNIETLDKRQLEVQVDNVIHPGFVHVVKGEGMPLRKKNDTMGDLHIHFTVKFPKEIADKSKNLIKEALSDCDY